MEDHLANISDKLSIINGVLGTDLTELAEELKVDRSTLSRIVNGKQKGLKTREQLATALCEKIRMMIIPPTLKGA